MISEVITESTPMALGLVVTVVGGFGGGIWKIVSSLTRVDHRLDMMEQSLGLRMESLEKRPHGFVSKSALRDWISAMRSANEGKGITWVRLDDIDEES